MTFADLVTQVTATAAPRLTFYSDEDRIELAGPTIGRWASKISGLLLADLGVEAGALVAVRLDSHWRALMWGLGVLQAGCTLDLGRSADFAGADVAVATTEEDLAEATEAGVLDVLTQPLPSLALAWPGTVPAGTEDAAQAVMSQPDALVETPWELAATDRPIVGWDASVTELLTPAEGVTPGTRVAWQAGDPRRDLARCLGIWLADGDAVLTQAPPSPRLLEQERATLAH